MSDEPVRIFAMTDAEAAWINDGLAMLAEYYHAIPAIARLRERFVASIRAQRGNDDGATPLDRWGDPA